MNKPLPRVALHWCLTIFLTLATGLHGQAKSAGPDGGPAGGRPQPRVWLNPEGQPLPFANDAELLDFLKTAAVKKMESVPVGITAPQKVLLEKDGIQAHAHFNSIDEEKSMATLRDGRREMGFRDSYRYQAAAYELAALLELDNVPPVVERTVRNARGALSIWIEHTMTEKDRLKKQMPPPRPQEWVRQMKTMHVFDNLIYNTDRNQGNILIDENWKLWMIDHTRAFRRQEDLLKPEDVTICGRGLYRRLREVSDEEIKSRMKSHLSGPEINGLLKRRVKLVSLVARLIQERGESAVLFSDDNR